MSKKSILYLTPAAVEHAHSILSKNPKAVGYFLALTKGGCAGLQYSMDLAYSLPKDVDLCEQDGIKIFVEKSSLLYLLGVEIDFQKSLFHTGFVFSNPNQKGSCGCGKSISF